MCCDFTWYCTVSGTVCVNLGKPGALVIGTLLLQSTVPYRVSSVLRNGASLHYSSTKCSGKRQFGTATTI